MATTGVAEKQEQTTDTILDLELSLFSQGQIRVVRCPKSHSCSNIRPFQHQEINNKRLLQVVAPIGDVPEEVFQLFMDQLHQYSHVCPSSHTLGAANHSTPHMCSLLV